MNKEPKPLELITEVITDIIRSPRWENSTPPLPNQITELSERINNGKIYQSLIQDPDLKLLIDLIESYEMAINDDWMPFEIQGLKLPQALEFIKGTRLIIQKYNQSEYPSKIVELHKKIRHANSEQG